MDLAELAKEECKVPETQSNSSRDKLEVPLLKGKAGPTPMGRTDAILDKLELYKAIYIDINYLELKEKIGKRVDKMKPENRKMLFDARDFGNLVIEKGKEYVNFLSDKIKTVTASA